MSHPAQIQSRIKIIMLAIVLIVFLSNGSLPTAQAQKGTPPLLFVFAEAETPFNADSPEPEYVIRSAYMNVNMELLFDAQGKARDAKALPEITLNLFPDVQYTGIVSKVNKTSTSTTWIGRLKGKQLSYFYLVVANDIFIAHVASLEGIYEVSWADDDLYKVVQVDQSQLGEDVVLDVDSSDGLGIKSTIAPKVVGIPPKIDVMVVYTAQARAAEGGAEQMQTKIELAMEETNESYANSGVLTRLRLVHAEEVKFSESGGVVRDFYILTDPQQKWFGQVNHLRDIYGADMVALIVKEKGDFKDCGWSFVYPWKNGKPDSSLFFQVTNNTGECMNQYTLAHEFGHLQGARHDNDPENTPFAYGHGYVYISGLTGWRTMMATSKKCPTPLFCPRLLYWSNPNITMGGKPMGEVGKSENYRVLNETAPIIARFYPTKVSDDFFSDFGIRYGGWSAVSGSWKVANGTYSTGTDGYFNSVKHTGKYVDFKYEAMLKRTVAKYNANNLIIRGDTSSLSAAKEWKTEYAFQYSNDGTFSVWKTESDGTTTPLKPWTAHSAIRPYNWNKLTVYAIGNRFSFLINNTHVWTGTDSSLTGGEVGIGRWDIVSGPNEFLIDWAELTSYIYLDTMTSQDVVSGDVVPGVELTGGTIDRSPSR